MNAKPKRRWYQFSLWIWFLGVYFIAIASRGLGLVVEEVNEWKRNHQVTEHFTGVLSTAKGNQKTEPQNTPPPDPRVESEIDITRQKVRHRNYLRALQRVENGLDPRFSQEPPSQLGEIKVTLPESPNEAEEIRAMQERKDLEALSASINGLRFHRVPNSSAPAPNPFKP